uniref:Uncharacterized protein n=1 Tax=Panagrolaimus sp. JU765 TaxID=591449 RepID=A0AC34QY12_9BILA
MFRLTRNIGYAAATFLNNDIFAIHYVGEDIYWCLIKFDDLLRGVEVIEYIARKEMGEIRLIQIIDDEILIETSYQNFTWPILELINNNQNKTTLPIKIVKKKQHSIESNPTFTVIMIIMFLMAVTIGFCTGMIILLLVIISHFKPSPPKLLTNNSYDIPMELLSKTPTINAIPPNLAENTWNQNRLIPAITLYSDHSSSGTSEWEKTLENTQKRLQKDSIVKIEDI